MKQNCHFGCDYCIILLYEVNLTENMEVKEYIIAVHFPGLVNCEIFSNQFS